MRTEKLVLVHFDSYSTVSGKIGDGDSTEQRGKKHLDEVLFALGL